MTTPLQHPVKVCLAHVARRRQQLPPLFDLPISDDDALAIVRQEEMARATAKLGAAIARARSA